MKAFLLAAGLGTRMRPLTDQTPKCLLTIGGIAMVDIWLDAMLRAGVSDVLVNLHHLADQVEAHVARRRRPPAVRLSYEPALLGSAGTLAANRDFVASEEFFLACYVDNLTDFDLSVLVERHRSWGGLATLALIHTDESRAKGIVELDADGIVASFEEKPKAPKSDLANAGIYAFAPSVIEFIAKPPADIGYDLLPRLVGKMQGFVIDAYLRDVGSSPEAYLAAEREWAARASA